MISTTQTLTGQGTPPLDISTEKVSTSFSTLQIDIGLHMIIDRPTREDNILYLFFMYRPSLVNRSTVIPGISDHHAIFIDSHSIMTWQKPLKWTILMWGKANIQRIKEMCKNFQTIIQGYTSKTNIDNVW